MYPLLEAARIALGNRRYDTPDTLLAQLSLRRAHFSAWDAARFDEMRGRVAIGADVDAVRRFVALAPRSASARFALVEALHELQHVDTMRLQRPLSCYWQYRTFILHGLGDYKGELESADGGQQEDSTTLCSSRVRALAARGRSSAIDSVLTRAPDLWRSRIYMYGDRRARFSRPGTRRTCAERTLPRRASAARRDRGGTHERDQRPGLRGVIAAHSGDRATAERVARELMSSDLGVSRSARSNGMTEMRTSGIVKAGTRLSVVGPSGVFRSDNQGDSWSAAGLVGVDVRCLTAIGDVIFGGRTGPR